MTSGPSASTSHEQRALHIQRVLWAVLALNWFVAALKIALGLSTRCMVIIVDGIHSLSDGASNIVGLVGISIASHPANKKHPYGHRKYETIASLIISFSLFFTSISIVRECVRQFMSPVRAEATALSFVVMGVTLAVNFGVAIWERREGRKAQSDLLIADSWHTFSDIFVTLSVFAALIGIHMGWKRADTFVSLGIAVFIAWIALQILVRSSQVLSDKAVLEEADVKKIAMKTPGVLDCHEIRSRGRLDDASVDLHVLVDPKMSVEQSHQLANVIERDIRQAFRGVTEVLVHIEPLHHDHTELEAPH